MFPGAGATVYRNEAGEPIGWDYPSEFDPNDRDDEDPGPDKAFECKCGDSVWADDEDEIVAHFEVCSEPDWFRTMFPDELADLEV